MIAIIVWLAICIVFVVWASGNVDPILRFIERKASALKYWVKGRRL